MHIGHENEGAARKDMHIGQENAGAARKDMPSLLSVVGSDSCSHLVLV